MDKLFSFQQFTNKNVLLLEAQQMFYTPVDNWVPDHNSFWDVDLGEHWQLAF